ncbi:MAG TPA: DinB family protein, partial [Terriglobales bacterium]|nr:DinB family protein [Terriglobales bacterium]
SMTTQTTVSPEKAKAQEYLTTRAEAMTATQIRARMRAAVIELDAAVDGVAEEAARASVVPGQWTIAQVVDHVAQGTIRVADELRCLIEGRTPPAVPVYEGIVSGAAHRVPFGELLQGMRAANAEVDALLGRAIESEPPAGATARTILVFNRADGTEEFFDMHLTWKGYAMCQRLHLLDHRTQIKKLRDAQGRQG